MPASDPTLARHAARRTAAAAPAGPGHGAAVYRPQAHPQGARPHGAHPPVVHQPGHNAWTMLSAHPGDQLSLMPGQLYFGSKAAVARTLLGSCVSITLWHPQRRLGGMCHFLLPCRKRAPGTAPEGRYGDEAVEMMVQRLCLAGTDARDYEATLYGGADTQSGIGGPRAGIGERNIEAGWQLIDHYGFALTAVDVGDNVPRTVQMCLRSGMVNVRRGQPIGARKTA